MLIAYQYFSFKGGIEQVLAVQAAGLDERGHEVQVLTSSYLENQPTQIAPGIPITRIQAINYLYRRHGIPFAVPLPTRANLRVIRKAVREADVVNVHGHPYLFSFVVMLFAALYRKPVVVTQHNTKIETKSPALTALYWVLESTIGRWNLRKADLVVAVSDQTADYVREVARSPQIPVIRIYNGVDTVRYQPVVDKPTLRRDLNIPNDQFVCLTVRRITFKNGIDTLLDAAEASLGNPEILFLLGGTGADMKSVEASIRQRRLSNLRLLGAISDDALPKYYAASDAFVLPSRPGEGFPMVVLESLASGLPVVATKSGGHVEVIKDGETGYLVDPDRPVEIVRRVKDLAKLDLGPISSHCRALAVDDFSWQSNIDQLSAAITNLTGQLT